MERVTIRFFEKDNDIAKYRVMLNANEDGLYEYTYDDEKKHREEKQRMIDKAKSFGYLVESSEFEQEFLNGKRNTLDFEKMIKED